MKTFNRRNSIIITITITTIITTPTGRVSSSFPRGIIVTTITIIITIITTTTERGGRTDLKQGLSRSCFFDISGSLLFFPRLFFGRTMQVPIGPVEHRVGRG